MGQGGNLLKWPSTAHVGQTWPPLWTPACVRVLSNFCRFRWIFQLLFSIVFLSFLQMAGHPENQDLKKIHTKDEVKCGQNCTGLGMWEREKMIRDSKYIAFKSQEWFLAKTFLLSLSNSNIPLLRDYYVHSREVSFGKEVALIFMVLGAENFCCRGLSSLEGAL